MVALPGHPCTWRTLPHDEMALGEQWAHSQPRTQNPLLGCTACPAWRPSSDLADGLAQGLQGTRVVLHERHVQLVLCALR